jgi:hypothetical protein
MGASELGFFRSNDMNTKKLANAQRGQAAQHLEGSRFVTRQLCKLAASGSREWPIAVQFYGRCANRLLLEQRPWVKALRWVFHGSRLLPSDRTAKLQSGSPPDVGHATCRGVFIARTN